MKNIIFRTPLTDSLELETIESLVRRMLDSSQLAESERSDLILDIAAGLKSPVDWGLAIHRANELVVALEELVGALWHITQLLNLPMNHIQIVRHGRSLAIQVQ